MVCKKNKNGKNRDELSWFLPSAVCEHQQLGMFVVYTLFVSGVRVTRVFGPTSVLVNNDSAAAGSIHYPTTLRSLSLSNDSKA